MKTKAPPRKQGRSGRPAAVRGNSRHPENDSTAGLVNLTVRLQRDQLRALESRCADLEARLKEQAERLKSASDEHPVPYIELLGNGLIRKANAGAIALLGEDEQKIIFAPFRRFVPSDDVEALYRHVQQCVLAPGRTQIATDLRIRTANSARPVRLVSRASVKKHPVAEQILPTAIVDMTEYNMCREIDALEARSFQYLLESVDGVVWEADYPLRLLFVSPQIEQILGYAAERWLSDPSFWERHIHVADRERVLQERHRAISTGGEHVMEYRFHSASRGLVWLRESLLVQRDTQGHVRLRGLAVNVTRLKQAEAELRRANERLAASARESKRHLEQTVQSMETFCYGIAHELRAPVRATRGFSELLLKEALQGEAACNYAQRISQAGAYMDKLIEDLLAYGRLHHTELLLVGVGVQQTVERVLRQLDSEIKERQARVDVRHVSERVQGHPMLLKQAVENLVSNALKFVPPGATPRVTISAEPTARGRVRINVRDEGVGVHAAAREKIFGVFQRGHSHEEYPGTGIGLAMVKRIAELMDGEVGLDSELGRGSCFWIELPAVSKSTPDQPA